MLVHKQPLNKLFTAIGFIGLIVGGCVGYPTSRMTTIDHASLVSIAQEATQISMGTNVVTANSAGVASATEEIGAAASKVPTSGSEPSHQSEHLGAEVACFLASVRAA